MARDFDNIRNESPFTSLVGDETIVLNQGGVTKGGFISVVREWVSNTIGTDFGRSILGMADRDALLEQSTHDLATTQEMADGFEEDPRSMSPLLVRQAIDAVCRRPNLAVETGAQLGEEHLYRLLVCEADTAISLILPEDSGNEGFMYVVNLGGEDVTIDAGISTLVGATGPISEIIVEPYGFVEIHSLGNATWYVKEA